MELELELEDEIGEAPAIVGIVGVADDEVGEDDTGEEILEEVVDVVPRVPMGLLVFVAEDDESFVVWGSPFGLVLLVVVILLLVLLLDPVVNGPLVVELVVEFVVELPVGVVVFKLPVEGPLGASKSLGSLGSLGPSEPPELLGLFGSLEFPGSPGSLGSPGLLGSPGPLGSFGSLGSSGSPSSSSSSSSSSSPSSSSSSSISGGPKAGSEFGATVVVLPLIEVFGCVLLLCDVMFVNEVGVVVVPPAEAVVVVLPLIEVLGCVLLLCGVMPVDEVGVAVVVPPAELELTVLVGVGDVLFDAVDCSVVSALGLVVVEPAWLDCVPGVAINDELELDCVGSARPESQPLPPSEPVTVHDV